MIHNAAVLHRGKHFDQLLERELASIERGHEQNLITYEKLERSIYREENHIKKLKRKKISLAPLDETYYAKSAKSRSSIISSTNVNSQFPVDEQLPPTEILPKYHRNCFKGERLPPIYKLDQRKQIKNDLPWIGRRQSVSTENEILTSVNEDLLKVSVKKLTPMQKHIHSFMETLPTYKGVHKGFDNFAAASRYSRRVPIAMR